jgi:lysophospholipid hydrolase
MDTHEASETLAHGVSLAARSLSSVITNAAATPSSQVVQPFPQNINGISSIFASLGRPVLSLLSIIPGVLFWLITFATITLPTWLFTLFSMSLTFTMNFTTLWVLHNIGGDFR